MTTLAYWSLRKEDIEEIANQAFHLTLDKLRHEDRISQADYDHMVEFRAIVMVRPWWARRLLERLGMAKVVDKSIYLAMATINARPVETALVDKDDAETKQE